MDIRRVVTLARRVFSQIVRDRRTLGLIFLAPIFILTLGGILFRSSPENLALGVVNEDEGVEAPAPVGHVSLAALIVEELEHAITDLGMVGLTLWPCFQQMFCNDRRYYPLYEKCVEHDVVFESHCSVNFSQTKRMDLAHPKYLDEVACDFPELKIIADHGGWPWINEVVAQAWRHYHFYICRKSFEKA